MHIKMLQIVISCSKWHLSILSCFK